MTRPRWRHRLLLLGVAGLLAACGGSQSSSGGPPAQASSPGVVAPPSAAAAASGSPVSPSAAPLSGAGASAAACVAPATPTEAETEGPYFKPGSPAKTSLVEPGMAGTRVTFSGLVLTTACTPIAGVLVDIWQADASGVYDNAGYRLRGHVLTDSAGRFVIETIEPGEYPGRTEHIHVKLTPPGGATLTTQVYFPGVPANDADGIYSSSMLLGVSSTGGGLAATYTFVLASS